MKIFLTGKNAKDIEGLVKNLGFELVNVNPDVIISYGGDGTLLTAEREYPGISKLPIRDSQFCNKCPSHDTENLLKKLLANSLKLKEYQKLETTILYKKFYALNEFVVRNASPVHAIRFQVDNRFLIGDGIVVSTPFGSTGYFRSITGQIFHDGFGVAFNNTTKKVSPVFLKGNSEANFKLVRGNATLTYDNSPDIFSVTEGSTISFRLSSQVAKIYELESLRCPDCQVIRS